MVVEVVVGIVVDAVVGVVALYKLIKFISLVNRFDLSSNMQFINHN